MRIKEADYSSRAQFAESADFATKADRIGPFDRHSLELMRGQIHHISKAIAQVEALMNYLNVEFVPESTVPATCKEKEAGDE